MHLLQLRLLTGGWYLQAAGLLTLATWLQSRDGLK